ncbi:hypothetical protein MMC25_004197 [Agyrium rufum]|nr:hypothetical protein [Agyrium rufum]
MPMSGSYPQDSTRPGRANHKVQQRRGQQFQNSLSNRSNEQTTTTYSSQMKSDVPFSQPRPHAPKQDGTPNFEKCRHQPSSPTKRAASTELNVSTLKKFKTSSSHLTSEGEDPSDPIVDTHEDELAGHRHAVNGVPIYVRSSQASAPSTQKGARKPKSDRRISHEKKAVETMMDSREYAKGGLVADLNIAANHHQIPWARSTRQTEEDQYLHQSGCIMQKPRYQGTARSSEPQRPGTFAKNSLQSQSRRPSPELPVQPTRAITSSHSSNQLSSQNSGNTAKISSQAKTVTDQASSDDLLNDDDITIGPTVKRQRLSPVRNPVSTRKPSQSAPMEVDDDSDVNKSRIPATNFSNPGRPPRTGTQLQTQGLHRINNRFYALNQVIINLQHINGMDVENLQLLLHHNDAGDAQLTVAVDGVVGSEANPDFGYSIRKILPDIEYSKNQPGYVHIGFSRRGHQHHQIDLDFESEKAMSDFLRDVQSTDTKVGVRSRHWDHMHKRFQNTLKMIQQKDKQDVRGPRYPDSEQALLERRTSKADVIETSAWDRTNEETETKPRRPKLSPRMQGREERPDAPLRKRRGNQAELNEMDAVQDNPSRKAPRKPLAPLDEGNNEGQFLRPRRAVSPIGGSINRRLGEQREQQVGRVQGERTSRSNEGGKFTRSKSDDYLSYDQDPQETVVQRKANLGTAWKKPLVFPQVGKKKATVEFDDLSRLDEGEFLNDNLIGFYMRYLEEQLEKHDPSVAKTIYWFNTYFYASLTQNTKGKSRINYDAVRKWTRNINIFDFDYLVIPINEAAHWYVAIICNLPALSHGGPQKDIVLEEIKPEVIAVNVDNDNTVLGVTVTTLADPEKLNHLPSEPVLIDEPNEQLARESLASFSIDDKMDLDEELKVSEINEPIVIHHMDKDKQEALPDVEPSALNKLASLLGEEDDIPPELHTEEDSTPIQHSSPNAIKFLNSMKKSKRRSSAQGRKFNPDQPTIITLDSLGISHPATSRALKDYLIAEAEAKFKLEIHDKQLQGMTAKDIPQQDNFCDCGVFVLGYLDKFVEDPRVFVRSIIKHEYDLDKDWPLLVPSQMRNELRARLLDLKKEQDPGKGSQAKTTTTATETKAPAKEERPKSPSTIERMSPARKINATSIEPKDPGEHRETAIPEKSKQAGLKAPTRVESISENEEQPPTLPPRPSSGSSPAPSESSAETSIPHTPRQSQLDRLIQSNLVNGSKPVAPPKTREETLGVAESIGEEEDIETKQLLGGGSSTASPYKEQKPQQDRETAMPTHVKQGMTRAEPICVDSQPSFRE